MVRDHETAAARYRPARVRLLLVAEAPPNASDRYFYFEKVEEHDHLFRAVVRTVLREEPARDKATQLRRLQACGVFLMDLKTDPKSGAGEDLSRFVPGLVERVVTCAPEHVVLIKANVYDLAYRPLRDANVPVVDERLPFPSSGRQTEFRDGMNRALRAINWLACD